MHADLSDLSSVNGREDRAAQSPAHAVVKDAGTPKTLPMQVEFVDVDSIKPHPRNPRRGDVGAIVESMIENGVYRPVIVQKSTGYIVAGSHTWQAQKATGVEKVPAIVLDLTDKQAVKILLADNRTADRGSYEDSEVAALLQSLVDDGELRSLMGTGYDGDDLDDMLNRLARDEAADDEVKNFKSSAVVFRFGDYAGKVSAEVYESFRAAFDKRRKDDDKVLLDDVLRSWLRLK